MPIIKRIARHGRLVAGFASLCPTLQDVLAEALANLFTEKVPIPSASWLAVPLGLMVSGVVEKLPGLFGGRAGWRSHVARWLPVDLLPGRASRGRVRSGSTPNRSDGATSRDS